MEGREQGACAGDQERERVRRGAEGRVGEGESKRFVECLETKNIERERERERERESERAGGRRRE